MELVEGYTYKVRYSYQAGNYRIVEREMVAKFIGFGHIGGKDVTFWNLRPLAGTQDLDAEQIRQTTRVPDGTPMKAPYKPKVTS